MKKLLAAVCCAALLTTPALAQKGQEGGGKPPYSKSYGYEKHHGDWKFGHRHEHYWHRYDGSGYWNRDRSRYFYHGEWIDSTDALILFGLAAGIFRSEPPVVGPVIVVPAPY